MGSTQLKTGFITKYIILYVYQSVCSTEEKTTESISTKFASNRICNMQLGPFKCTLFLAHNCQGSYLGRTLAEGKGGRFVLIINKSNQSKENLYVLPFLHNCVRVKVCISSCHRLLRLKENSPNYSL